MKIFETIDWFRSNCITIYFFIPYISVFIKIFKTINRVIDLEIYTLNETLQTNKNIFEYSYSLESDMNVGIYFKNSNLLLDTRIEGEIKCSTSIDFYNMCLNMHSTIMDIFTVIFYLFWIFVISTIVYVFNFVIEMI